jgi:hypothetical protein
MARIAFVAFVLLVAASIALFEQSYAVDVETFVDKAKRNAEKVFSKARESLNQFKLVTTQRVNSIASSITGIETKVVSNAERNKKYQDVASKSQGNRDEMKNTLDSYGITRSLHSEIIGMSSSNVPRETIIAHVQVRAIICIPEK